MADILKVTTPIVDNSQVHNQRQVKDPTMPFNLSDVTRVVQTNTATELLQQNTGLTEAGPRILTDLMKDPAVTVSMMRNIALLQEVIKLIPTNNAALTQEVGQLFSQMLLSPDQIVDELISQENNTTFFKGDLFDTLRSLLQSNMGDPDLMTGIGILLKSINAAMSREDALHSVSNNLNFLLDSLTGRTTADTQAGILGQQLLDSTTILDANGNPIRNLADILAQVPQQGGDFADLFDEDGTPRDFDTHRVVLEAQGTTAQNLSNVMGGARLTEKLDILIQLLRMPGAQSNYSSLKNATLSVLKDVERSVLYSGELEKTIPLTIYNLSRFNDNEDFFPDAVRLLLSLMQNGEDKSTLMAKLQEFSAQFMGQDGAAKLRDAAGDSEVMSALSRLIGKHASTEELELVSGERLEKIVSSMLSSPSNFTPLLHFILPVEYMDRRAFAEIWIDPNADGEEPKGSGGEPGTHMLMVFDVDDIGRFESELFVQGKRIAMNLLCPPKYVENFLGIAPAVRKAIEGTGYRFEAIHIDKLDKNHSLMDVFTDLPMRRMGVDVKI